MSPKLLRCDLIGALVFGLVGLAMAYPYLRVISLYPYARRTERDLVFSSPPLKGFFIAPPESLVWGDLHAPARAALAWPPETAMLIGFVLYGLAAAGLVMSIWTVRQRVLLAVGAAVSLFWAMGTSSFAGGVFGYLVLYRWLPGFDAIRTSGRLVIWTTLLLGILAAGAVAALAERAHTVLISRGLDRPSRLVGVATLLPMLLVLLEGLNQTPHPVAPTAPVVLRTVAAPLLILPSDQLNDEQYMLWTADGFPAVVNGGSGFTPRRQATIRSLTEHFPDPASIDELRTTGVRTVVVVRSRAAGTPYEYALRARVDGLDVRRQDRGDVVIFTLVTGG
jgi:hypothetical protein